MFTKQFIDYRFFIRLFKLKSLNYSLFTEKITSRWLLRVKNDILPFQLFAAIDFTSCFDSEIIDNVYKIIKRFKKDLKRRMIMHSNIYIIVRNKKEFHKLNKYFYDNGFCFFKNNKKIKEIFSQNSEYYVFSARQDNYYESPELRFLFSTNLLTTYLEEYYDVNGDFLFVEQYIKKYEKFKKRIWFRHLSIVDKIKNIFNKKNR